MLIGGDLNVSRLGFGAMRLTGTGMWGDYPDREAALALLRTVIKSGVTFIDTADSYGPHTNELLIRDALHPYPAGLVIATKGGFIRGGPDYSDFGAVGNREYLRQCAYLSARRLGVQQIDLYYLHRPDARDTPFLDQVGTLAELAAEGVIRHIGLSNVSAEQFEQARSVADIAAVTGLYNIWNRASAALLAAAEAAGAAFSPWRPTTPESPPPARRGSTCKKSSGRSLTVTRQRSGSSRWPGCCTARRGCCPSRAQRAHRTLPRTSRQVH